MTAQKPGDKLIGLSRGDPSRSSRDLCENPTSDRSVDRCARPRVVLIGQRTALTPRFERVRPYQPKTGSIDFVEDFPTLARLTAVRDGPRTSGQPRASRVSALGQATKGVRWMPWRQEPMKDVAGDEMLRGAASKRYYPEISEWGNPPRVMPGYDRLNL